LAEKVAVSRGKSIKQRFEDVFSRKSAYKSFIDVCVDFFLVLTTKRPFSTIVGPLGLSLPLRPRSLSRSIYLRMGHSDIRVAIDNFYNGEYAKVEEMGLSDKPVIFDLGANIGLSALLFLSWWPEAQIISVEPDAANLKMLKRNCRSELSTSNLQEVYGFVAARDGAAGIDRSSDSWAFKKADLSPAGNGESIPCISIPSLMQQFNIENIDLFKCDIEGSEAELFAHCKPWINRIKNMVVETHPPYSLQDLYKDLQQAGWDFQIHQEIIHPASSVTFLSRRA
jgi:FkbM family methyltransferase